MVIQIGDEGIVPPRPRQEPEEAKPRRVFIKRDDVVEHGATAGCPGCRAARLGQTAQGHMSEEDDRGDGQDEQRQKETRTSGGESRRRRGGEEKEGNSLRTSRSRSRR